jgi:tRNA 2-thiocytidine biosynthesis protein TtcA
MLSEWERKVPGRKRVMLRALTQARPSHLLDPSLFDFQGLGLADVPRSNTD